MRMASENDRQVSYSNGPGAQRRILPTMSALVLVALVGCNGGSGSSGNGSGSKGTSPQETLSGRIQIDGSSTVYPITSAVAEAFEDAHQKKVTVTVGRAGTGGGFKRFVVGETQINDSSRPILEKEIEECKKHNIEYLELKVAIDGLSVVVNPMNTWCASLSVEQLNDIWKPDSTIKKWKQINPEWPDETIKLFGADNDSGTFDFFTEVINGKAKQSRSDYTQSADDNTLVSGVQGEKFALGYIPFSYYVQNKGKLKVVPIVPKGGDKAVEPTLESIESGAYTPLARPLFLHVNTKALARKEVAAFLTYYLNEGQKVVPEVKAIPLPASEITASRDALAKALTAATESGSETKTKDEAK